ncbi:MAG: CHAT domain-containing protein [candidate division Zixibacteria bacterium]|nr:CHAT domain-containing protein [candidate division Zixibacteria bacterium]
MLPILVFFGAGVAKADTYKSQFQDVYDLLDRSQQALLSYDYDSALMLAEAADQTAVRLSDLPDTVRATIYIALAKSYYELWDFANCERYLALADSIRSAVFDVDNPRRIEINGELGRLYISQAKYYDAERELNTVRSYYESLAQRNDSAFSIVLGNLATVYRFQGRYEEAESLCVRVIALDEQVLGPTHPAVGNSLREYAILLNDVCRYAEAEKILNRAVHIIDETLGPDHIRMASCLHGLAACYEHQGRYQDAIDLYKRVLDIHERFYGADNLTVASALSELAGINLTIGRYDEAEPLFLRALEIQKQKLGMAHSSVATTCDNLACLYYMIGKYEDAKPLFEQSLQIREQVYGSDHPDVAYSLNNLATLLRKTGNLEAAEQLQLRALAIREATLEPDNPNIAYTLLNLTNLYRHMKRYDKAETMIRRAIAIWQKTSGPESAETALALKLLGDVCQHQGKYADAEKPYECALRITDSLLGPMHPNFSYTAEALARLYGLAGKFDKGIRAFQRLIASRQQLIEYAFSYASEDLKLRWVDEHPLIDDSFLSLALLSGDSTAISSVFEMILKGKAAVLDAMMAEKEVTFCAYDQEMDAILDRRDAIRTEIANSFMVGLREGAGIGDSVRILLRTQDSLDTQLSRRCAAFGEKLDQGRFGVADVAAELPERGLLCEYLRYIPYDYAAVGHDSERFAKPCYLAMTLDRSKHMRLVDLGDASAIDSLVQTARKMMYDSYAGVFSPLAAEFEQQLAVVTGRLYALVMEPLLENNDTGYDLYVAPDGMLNLLAFEILSDSDTSYLIESHRICYLSSGRDLLRDDNFATIESQAVLVADPDFDAIGLMAAFDHDQQTDTRDWLAFATPARSADCLHTEFVPLRYSRKEVAAIAEMLETGTDMTVRRLDGPEAREEALKALGEPPAIMHLATHGFFCKDDSASGSAALSTTLLKSGLALAGANHAGEEQSANPGQDDGILTAYEVSGLNLVGTRLAVLSACETGLGDISQGEGVFGLQRAFRHAGAQAVCMSLWKVPDQETAHLMHDFYEAWLDGKSRRDALREAELRMLVYSRIQNGHGHPLLWGGFIMTGDPD